MSYLHLRYTRTRERTPDYTTAPHRPLDRNNATHPPQTALSEDSDFGHDDYPYSHPHQPRRSTSHALTTHTQPSPLERYNVWSDHPNPATPPSEEDDQHHHSSSSFEPRKTYTSRSHRHTTDAHDPLHRAFDLERQANLATTGSWSGEFHLHRRCEREYQVESVRFWPGESLRRSERRVDEGWEVRGRSVSRGRERFWGGAEEREESWSRSRHRRRVKSSRTEEVVPLSGWRRRRIVVES